MSTKMRVRIRSYLGWGMTLALGIVLGGVLAGGGRPVPLLAGAGDHPEAAVITSGPIGVEMDANKTPITKDAVYYLNYSRGRLFAAVPFPLQTPGSSRILSDFAERDLLQDFQLTPGRSYHFTMTTGSTGAINGGVAPLYVFETTTGQMAVYQLRLRFTAISATAPTASSTAPVIELVERRTDARLGQAGRQVAAGTPR